MALRIIVKVDANAALSLNNRCAATRTVRPFRTATAATARHRIESQRFPQIRLPRSHVAEKVVDDPPESIPVTTRNDVTGVLSTQHNFLLARAFGGEADMVTARFDVA
jgi:hypothetical protein